MTAWETPSFLEIDMSAEIGGYQGDDERPGFDPAFVQPAAPAAVAVPSDSSAA